MSSTIRQSNIFGSVEWQVAYESFLEADYAAYEYNTIYESMVNYIRKHYSDDFNDFIRNSELMAHVNLLAYLGQGYAFRNDVNAKENFMDDAIRRESIINIASTLTYKVRRNVPAHGLLKITSISTTENINDSDGMSLSNRRIYWNQRGLPTWYDSFIKIVESSFKRQNRFGRPFQKVRGQNYRLEVYEVNQEKNDSYVFPFFKSINGKNLRFEVVPSVIENDTIVERHPSTIDPFTIVYQNHGDGNDSADTGFFLQFKQGLLQSRDFFYTTPKIDRSEIVDIKNINDSDVWLHQIDENGNLLEYWYDVPKESGQNIIYNEIPLDQRNIYFSKTKSHDKVEILYGDGNFSLAPTNHMRVWVRQSENERYSIRKHDMSEIELNIPYINQNGKPHTLTVYLTNEQDINTAQVSESIESIKKNLREDHYRQTRMVTIEDYNIFPFERNPLRKLVTLNRDNASKSRYPFLETHDPTGMHSNLFVNAVDGYIYDDYYSLKSKFTTENVRIDKNTITVNHIEPLLKSPYFKSFYHNTAFATNYGYNRNPYTFENEFPRLYWKNTYSSNDNRKGVIHYKEVDDFGNEEWVVLNTDTKDVMRGFTKLLFLHNKKEYWTTIISTNNGIEVSDYIPTNAYLYMAIPSPSLMIDDNIKEKILETINKQESFGLRYDDIMGKWIMINQDNIIESNEVYDINKPQSPVSPDNRWLVRCIFVRDYSENHYDITVRGSRTIFGSDRQVRFFFKNTDWVTDVETGLPVLDYINIKQDDETYGVSELKPKHDEYVSKRSVGIDYLEDMD